ncbi:hypothetical protein HYO65_gp104 [Tenacibaculum phage PTm1]|uniref:Uncharacterized protein n=2 Tax=Shirahamavirus PTm1 TaxID=2846435 RepID=A0A5S9HX73_9CAUD|nr:hypothetical protein HYO65_gp104 [Tenacibaculum phage PTm1]BBI90496.1 hypothetical protein [Tenacibaculum phage PTm1]BBI90804.1 hypothetical protein [Tenacibaculum phage PTm5]
MENLLLGVVIIFISEYLYSVYQKKQNDKRDEALVSIIENIMTDETLDLDTKISKSFELCIQKGEVSSMAYEMIDIFSKTVNQNK